MSDVQFWIMAALQSATVLTMIGGGAWVVFRVGRWTSWIEGRVKNSDRANTADHQRFDRDILGAHKRIDNLI